MTETSYQTRSFLRLIRDGADHEGWCTLGPFLHGLMRGNMPCDFADRYLLPNGGVRLRLLPEGRELIKSMEPL